ncbi:hypothetical protein BofuT4_P066150.1 [Botrytis cinerea T4]|uniref:Uncharacterized protein n=1 Tax=Botryotinia fuckeliana (strain T4) TaxID=999810 RepID=G2XRU0_BOTF4|nr:hypothetical protein BofuT4_P066150.1 [Botrytis cinerea T4]
MGRPALSLGVRAKVRKRELGIARFPSCTPPQFHEAYLDTTATGRQFLTHERIRIDALAVRGGKKKELRQERQNDVQEHSNAIARPKEGLILSAWSPRAGRWEMARDAEAGG